jgi:concanavalin A-like lectin/glucanase superfamily protein
MVTALTFAIAGLTGLQAAADDPPVPPSAPQITVSYNGVEIVDCFTQTVCPKTAVAGEPVTVTITATSPNVVRHRVRFNSKIEDLDGANLTLSLAPPSAGWNTLDVQSINEIGQFGTSAHFLFNAGPRPAPIGSWSFDDGSGTTAADAATPAHPLTVVNGGAFDGKGRIAGSLALDGTNDYAEAADPVVDTSKSFTISAWVRPTKANQTGVIAAVAGTNSSAFGLYYDASAKRWAFARSSADITNPTPYRALSKEAPVNGAWTHLIGSYDAATGSLELLVNGRVQQTASSPTAPAWHATGPLTVGRAKYAGAFTGQFAGSIDQLQIWQRLLVAEELPNLVEPRFGPSGNDQPASGTAAYWPLDNALQGSGNVWRTAELVRGADLTVAGFGAGSNQSGAFVNDAERGRVLQLTGRSREAVTLDHPVVDASGSFTLAAWVKVGDPAKPMVVARQGTSGKDSWRLEYRPVDEFSSQWVFARGDAASTAETLAVGNVQREELDGWHLISATYDARAGDPSSARVELAMDIRTRGLTTYRAGPLRVGSTVVGAGRTSGMSFVGSVDDLRLYAGVASQTRLCEDNPGLDNCGS